MTLRLDPSRRTALATGVLVIALGACSAQSPVPSAGPIANARPAAQPRSVAGCVPTVSYGAQTKAGAPWNPGKNAVVPTDQSTPTTTALKVVVNFEEGAPGTTSSGEVWVTLYDFAGKQIANQSFKVSGVSGDSPTYTTQTFNTSPCNLSKVTVTVGYSAPPAGPSSFIVAQTATLTYPAQPTPQPSPTPRPAGCDTLDNHYNKLMTQNLNQDSKASALTSEIQSADYSDARDDLATFDTILDKYQYTFTQWLKEAVILGYTGSNDGSGVNNMVSTIDDDAAAIAAKTTNPPKLWNNVLGDIVQVTGGIHNTSVFVSSTTAELCGPSASHRHSP